MQIVVRQNEARLAEATDTRELKVVVPHDTPKPDLDRLLRDSGLGQFDQTSGHAWIRLERIVREAVAGGCHEDAVSRMISLAEQHGWVADNLVRAHVEYTAPAGTGFRDVPAEQRTGWWRKVLGEYPTGVAIISALDDKGTPQGLVVGTFSSVSMDPPIVSFMPMRSSRSYTAIANCTRFRVSVLGAAHEELCRSFASAAPEDRFDVGNWVPDEHGIPHLTDALVWFDCVRSQTIAAGDHDIVLGEVHDLGVGGGSAGMPMLFLKGGYGTFTMPRLDFDARHLGTHLRVADRMSESIHRLAEEIGNTVTLCSLAQDSVVVLSAANVGVYRQTMAPVGATFPFAAPMGLVFVAWDEGVRLAAWQKAGRAVGFADEVLLDQMVRRVRERGYAVSIGPTMADRFSQVMSDPTRSHDDINQLWQEIASDYADLREKSDWAAHVSSIQVPIFDADGVPDLALVVAGIPPGLTEMELDHMAARCREVARELTYMVGRTASSRQ
ncbi:flavin reductase [Nocardioides sp. NPDC127503]|uniref:flavin reductase n=1 Tax=Nocardioides sp. NPDC127503 TaxID=3154516 RepID=UPI0033181E38